MSSTLISDSRIDLELFIQIDPKKYQSRPPLPEVVPGAQSDSSVHLITLPFYVL
jgi:hypothetical protein